MRQRELPDLPGIDPRTDAVVSRLQALADPVRLRLLGLLSRGDCPVGPLATALGIGQSLVSFHLAALRDADLLTLERTGRYTYARLQPDAIRDLFGQVNDLVSTWPEAEAQPGADQHASEHLAAELAERFRRVGAARVERVVREESRRTRQVGGPADLLVRRHATERLRAIAQADGHEPKPVPEVLFVCVHNAGRSQMAAALAEQLGRGRIHAWSAGSQPADQIHSEAAAVMAEIGIDLTGQIPKPWTNELLRAADVVVTMGCGEDCPVYPGVRYLEWAIPDPAGCPLDEVRRIRDQLTEQVRALVADLTTPLVDPPAGEDAGGSARTPRS
jgi:ArsR family transcriptional regulator